jgi:hypothetical protein
MDNIPKSSVLGWTAGALVLIGLGLFFLRGVPATPQSGSSIETEESAITYVNASADLIKVDTPPPGAVTGKEFKVMGQARGYWFFEASFPIDVLDKDGTKLVTVVASR